MPTNVEILAEVPLFALLDEAERTQLAARLDTVRVEAGKVLFHQGEPGGALYVVRSGAVEIFVKNDTGERIVLETPHAGDFFGEISMLDGGPRTASAVVTEELEALVVDRGDLDEFLRLCPAAAMDLLAASGRRLRETNAKLRRAASRNVNVEDQDRRTLTMKVTDWVADFSGSLPFLFMHLAFFGTWIALNVGPLRRLGGFDPFPFGLLTMVVSLEAIMLSVLVLLAQNRQTARERVRNDVEYEINLKAELEIAHMHEKVDHQHAQVLARLEQIEQRVTRGPQAS